MSEPATKRNQSGNKRRFWIVCIAILLCLVTWIGCRGYRKWKVQQDVSKLGGRVSQQSRVRLPFPLQTASFDMGPIIRLELNHPDINDDQVIELLRQSPDLQYVILDSCGVTDAVLKELEGRNLQYLSVMNTKISDQGLRHWSKVLSGISTCKGPTLRMPD